MPRSRTFRRPFGPLVIIATVVCLAAAACSSKSSTSATGSTSVTTSPSANSAAVLGTPNKATGSPIKFGYVGDGKTDAIDFTSQDAAAAAAVKYANDYLGGLDGHVITLDKCATLNTPSGATTCGVQMVHDKVAAVLVPASAQDGAIFKAMSGSNIPYVTATSASPDIILKPGAFVLTNPIGSIGAIVPLAQSKGVKNVAFIVIDVPAATGPISQIATPFFQKAGIELNMVPVSTQVADMTPQVQDALTKGAKLFAITGTESFMANAVKALKQLGFTGDIVANLGGASAATIASIPGGLAGVTTITSTTGDPNNKDVQLFNAVMSKYASGTPKDAYEANGFVVVDGLLRALAGAKTATNAASITAALNSMPKPVALPLGGGITVQCGAKLVSYAPALCTTGVLQATLDKNGNGTNYKLVDVAKFIKLG